ncbi:MAG: glycoside hydrolase family 44 protein [Pseudomonadota bacterium]
MLKKRFVAAAVLGMVAAASGAVVLRKLRQHRHDPQTLAKEQVMRVAKPLDTGDAAQTIYDGKLHPGWQDWGWGPHDLSKPGPAKIVFSGYGGLILQHGTVQPQFSGLSFRYKAPASWPYFLSVSLRFTSGSTTTYPVVAVEKRHLAQLADGFLEVLIPWRELDPTNAPFDRVVLSAGAQVGPEAVLIDKVLLIRSDAEHSASAPKRDTELAIQCTGAGHVISPSIYGSADGDWESGATGRRMGGNPTTRYNWELSLWNSANDWFFENQKGANLETFLAEGVSHQSRVALTVPIIGWVAKDATSVGFPIQKFAKQQKTDPSRPEAGNGIDPSGKPLTPGSPAETSIEAPPEKIAAWVRAVHARDTARGVRTVDHYILDNEPSIWDETHRDVHPKPVTYDELLDRTVRYASAIREADPELKIAGPAEWGWLGYLYSGRDRVDGKFVRSDRRAHGDEPLIVWYLKQLAQYEKEHGTRLLDILDLHFYPAADGIYGGNARTDDEGAELRLRSTRALWDGSYVDESWINEPIRLIPRMEEWIAANYPGLQISIGEWSFGADNHISGGLATAEALGRFGQQGVDSAYYWGGPKKGSSTFWAFRAFRNFDGQGGHFLGLSVPTRESEKVSLFASRDEARDHFVAIAINRDALFAITAHITLDKCGAPAAMRAFTLSAETSGLLATSSPTAAGGGLTVSLPPYSVTVLDFTVTPD